MVKKRVALALTAALLLGSTLPAFASTVTSTVYGQQATREFSDIQANTPIAQAIGDVVEAGLMTGEPNGAFAPNKFASADTFAMALVKYLGLGSQVPAGSGSSGYLKVAENDGLLPSGTSGSQSLARVNVAVSLAKALKLSPVSGTLPWTDASSIAAGDRGYLLALYQKSYFKGYTNGTFGTSNSMTREQVALVFSRLLGL